MSHPSLLLKEGAAALNQGQYAAAIASLKAFCDSPVPADTKAYLRGHQWLVQAYIKQQETELALEICRKLSESKAPAAEQWANQAIPKLKQAIAQKTPQQAPQEKAKTRLQANTQTQLQPPVEDPVEEQLENADLEVETTADSAAIPSDNLLSAQAPSAQAPSAPRGTLKTVSGIPYKLPPGARAKAPTPEEFEAAAAKARAPRPIVSQRDPNDYTAVIQSAMSHGAITFILSWLLYWLFPWTIAASLDLLRFAVPVIIYCTATDPIAKINAKEATNYVITMMVITVAVLGGSVFLGLGLLGIGLLLGPLILLLVLPLVAYSLVLAFYPVVGTIICLSNPDKTFHYPRWLIWHAIA